MFIELTDITDSRNPHPTCVRAEHVEVIGTRRMRDPGDNDYRYVTMVHMASGFTFAVKEDACAIRRLIEALK
jgi:hypothetical protein